MNSSQAIASSSLAKSDRFGANPIDWAFAAGLVALLPLISVQAANLWSKQHLQFFPLAWIAFLAAVLNYREHLASKNAFRKFVGFGCFASSILFLLLSVASFSPWIAHISLISLVLGWMYLRFGKLHWMTVLTWIGLLIVTLPLPMNLDERLIQLLQIKSSQSASSMLDLLGIQHLLLGNVIEVREGRLFVDQACSGVDSLYALFAISLILVVWQKRSFFVASIQLCAVPIWAWLGNVVRLLTITYFYDRVGIDLLHGWQHTLLGMSTFALAFACMILTQQMIQRVFSPLPTGRHNASWTHEVYNRIVRWPKKSSEASATSANETMTEVHPKWLSISAISAAIVFVCLGVASFGPIFMMGPWKQVVVELPGIDRGAVEATFNTDSLPQNFGSLVRTDFRIVQRERDDLFGEYSSTWYYQEGARGVIVSLDFPFPSFHALEVCYQLTGSQIVGSVYDSEYQTSQGKKHIRHCELMDEFNERTYIYYMEFTASGYVDKATRSFWERLVPTQLREPLFQAQIVVKNAGALDENDHKRYRQLLLESQELFLPMIQSMK